MSELDTNKMRTFAKPTLCASTLAVATCCSLAAGCAPEKHTNTVGPEGGTIHSDGVTLEIPAGALGRSTDISVTETDERPDTAVGPAFRLEPEGLVFEVPIDVVLPFRPSELPEGLDSSAVRVLTAPGGSLDFTALDGELRDSTHVSASTSHFSTWVAGTTPITPLVPSLNFPNAVAVDGSRVYWLDTAPGASTNLGRVMSFHVDVGTSTLLAQDQVDPKRIALDDDFVYWTTGGHDAVKGTVCRVPKSGGIPTVLSDGLAFPRAIAVDGANVYWSDFDDGNVRKAPVTGGATTVIASSQAKVDSIATDGLAVYWTANAQGTVMRWLPDGTATALAQAQPGPSGIALDAFNVYWVNAGTGDADGSVMRVSKLGGTPMLIAGSQKKPFALAVDGRNAYWANRGTGSIARVPAAGGTVVTLAGAQSTPYAVALDDTHVYWADNGMGIDDGAVLAIPK